MNCPVILTRKLLMRAPSVTYRLSFSNTAREGKFLNKLMTRHKPKGKMYNFEGLECLPSTQESTNRPPINHRRMSVLNKLFMKNITEVLATGSMAANLEGLGIDITKVSITSDFQKVNVFFVCKSKLRPPDLEKSLEDTSFSLRHELSQLKLMGVVPRISFVEDKTMKRLSEVEVLLSEADFPCEEESVSPVEGPTEEVLSEIMNIPHQVYRLNHTKIFNKIVVAKRASSNHHKGNQLQTCFDFPTPAIRRDDANEMSKKSFRNF